MNPFFIVAAWIFLFFSPCAASAGGHGFVGLGAAAVDYPDYNGAGSDIPATAEVRAGIDSDLLGMHFESDLDQLWGTRSATSAGQCGPEIERSRLFYLDQRCSGRVDSHLVVDRLLLRGRIRGMDFAVGRQPINLATTFYFSANDFFAPFSETDFFRQYRPGVDALRFDYGPGPLSQLSVIEVLSYRFRPDLPGGWSRSPDWRRSSTLIRYLDNPSGFEAAFITGTVRDVLVLGASGAGEISDWLGIRGEAHYGRAENGDGDYVAGSVGLDHQHENSLFWRLEYLYNGNSGNTAGNQAASAIPAAARPGRDYLALGLGYEFTPLLTGELLAATNLTDDSRLFSLYLLYSLSDNSEIALSLARGDGDGPAASYGGSEYGVIGESASLTWRLYL